ncbi:hypothetical protein E2C01_035540 [Portunus trituberculatus]|uniref:Uncharacterized protein n=1 Tax=Portunus trituberculatus TaxID=210409 RepID=A0A5B7FA10_PORTR|nr:hypothetical protein [Portunus trituberculatus]
MCRPLVHRYVLSGGVEEGEVSLATGRWDLGEGTSATPPSPCSSRLRSPGSAGELGPPGQANRLPRPRGSVRGLSPRIPTQVAII